MLIRWQDRDYDLDLSDFTLKQARVIEGETGQPLGKWLDVLSDEEHPLDQDSPHFLPALKIIYWLMLNQSGDDTPIGAVDFPVVKFGRAFMAGMAAEENGHPAEAAALPDPTRRPAASAPSRAQSSRKPRATAKASPDG